MNRNRRSTWPESAYWIEKIVGEAQTTYFTYGFKARGIVAFMFALPRWVPWLCAGIAVFILVTKEKLLPDKGVSTIVTALVALLMSFIAGIVISAITRGVL
jgi:ABC-type spermidine/putrescine transport system permease subunit II